MAKPQKPQKVNGSHPAEFVVPEGFERSSAPKGTQNWIKYAPNLQVEGKLLGRFEKRNQNGAGFYYTIELTKPTEAMRKPDSESPAEVVLCKPGETVCIDEKACIKEWAKLATNGGKYLVSLFVVGKIDIKGGQTYWDGTPYHKLVGGKPRVTAEAEADIPF